MIATWRDRLDTEVQFRVSSLRQRRLALITRLICARADHWWGNRTGVAVCRFCRCVGVPEPRFVRCTTCGLFQCRHQPDRRTAS